MVKLLLAYDEADPTLGTYFKLCFSDINSYASERESFVLHELGEESNKNKLSDFITSFQSDPFIFVAYTHGRSDAIVHSNRPLVDQENSYFFGKSLVYTCACSAGQELAGILKQANCYAFIGFNSDTNLLSTEKHDDIFKDCENYGLKIFMCGGKTIQESYDAMYQNYTKQFNDLYHDDGFSKAPFDLAILLDIQKALFMDAEGSEHLTLEDFHSSL